MNRELHRLLKKLNKEITVLLENDEIEKQQKIREELWESQDQEEYMKNVEKLATDLYLLLTRSH